MKLVYMTVALCQGSSNFRVQLILRCSIRLAKSFCSSPIHRWQLKHAAKVGGEPSQYLRVMNEITPYRPEIRFSDVDAYGVVHNAKYIVYMEQARIHWWRQAMGEGTWDWSKVGVLVAHHTIDYVRPVRLGDVLEVSSHIGALGNKSMDVHYEMTCNGHPVARAKTVLVCFDHQTQATIPVPEPWRQALAAFIA